MLQCAPALRRSLSCSTPALQTVGVLHRCDAQNQAHYPRASFRVVLQLHLCDARPGPALSLRTRLTARRARVLLELYYDVSEQLPCLLGHKSGVGSLGAAVLKGVCAQEVATPGLLSSRVHLLLQSHRSALISLGHRGLTVASDAVTSTSGATADTAV